MRVKMVVAYDGTNYSGWQIQPNGVTIEQKLNEALQALLGEDIRVTGASRTDAGVHSLGNVCIFDTDTRMPAEKISYALNQRLPEDIVVQDSCEVPDTFHPRFSRSRKTYEYRILNRRFRMPTRRLDTYFYHYPLDVEKMQEAADYLVGEHDFKSFCAVNAFFPFVTFYVDKNSWLRITAGIDNRIDFSNLAADRRVDGRGYETTGFGNLCADFHHISFSYNRLCRRTDVLAQQNHSFGRNFRLYNRLMC